MPLVQKFVARQPFRAISIDATALNDMIWMNQWANILQPIIPYGLQYLWRCTHVCHMLIRRTVETPAVYAHACICRRPISSSFGSSHIPSSARWRCLQSVVWLLISADVAAWATYICTFASGCLSVSWLWFRLRRHKQFVICFDNSVSLMFEDIFWYFSIVGFRQRLFTLCV